MQMPRDLRMQMDDRAAAYLILTPNAIFALDLAQTVSEFDPGARVLVASTAQEAAGLIARAERIRVALVGVDPAVALPLQPAVAARGGTLVLLGSAVDLAAAGWTGEVLDIPFNSERVIALLARLDRL